MYLEDGSVAVGTARGKQLVVVFLAVGPAVAVVVGGATELHITLGTGEVLLVPLATKSIDHLCQDRLAARRTHSCQGTETGEGERERETGRQGERETGREGDRERGREGVRERDIDGVFLSRVGNPVRRLTGTLTLSPCLTFGGGVDSVSLCHVLVKRTQH